MKFTHRTCINKKNQNIENVENRNSDETSPKVPIRHTYITTKAMTTTHLPYYHVKMLVGCVIFVVASIVIYANFVLGS